MQHFHKSLMFNAKFTLPYQDNDLDTTETSLKVVIPLKDNQIQVSTDSIVISTSEGYWEVNAIINYRYDAELNLIDFCGNDLKSTDSIRLRLIRPNGNNPTIINSYQLQESAFLETLRISLRSVNDQIIEYAENSGLNVIVRTPFPDLEPKLNESLKIVQYKGQILELFNPAKYYDSDHKVIQYESVHYGIGKLAPGQKFANVIGSTADPNFGRSWLMLWKNTFGPVEMCTSHEYQKFKCSNRLVGGHCILGDHSQVIHPGSNFVFIAPICIQHNNNDNVYMIPLQNDGKVIVLEGYLLKG